MPVIQSIYNIADTCLDVDTSRAKEITAEIVAKVRQQIGPIACFKDVIIVPRLPKTRSGKIARNTLAAIVADKPYKVTKFVHKLDNFMPVNLDLLSLFSLILSVIR